MINVRGELAARYGDYRRDRRALADASESYREFAVHHPEACDAATLAVALRRTVRFTGTANTAFLRRLRGGSTPTLAELHAGITVNRAGRAIITACESRCADALAAALTFLFMDEHQSLIHAHAGDEVDIEPSAREDETDEGDDALKEDE